MTDTLHIATYNIHKGFSNFNRRMVVHELRDRLRRLGADLVFLQEVQGDHQEHAERFPNWPDEPQYEFLADAVWSDFAYGRNAVYDSGHHGNAVLSRFPITRWDNEDISAHALESRGLLHCEIAVSGWAASLHCVCVHLGLTTPRTAPATHGLARAYRAHGAAGRTADRRRGLQRLADARGEPVGAPVALARGVRDHARRAGPQLSLRAADVAARSNLCARLSGAAGIGTSRPAMVAHLRSRRAVRDRRARMTEFRDGNEVRLLIGGGDYFGALEAAIDGARREVYLETYIYEDDVTGRRIGEALVRSARRGVLTRLMVDGFGSKHMPASLRGRLQAAGVELLDYRPDITPFNLRRSRLRRLHRKLAVIDASVALVGGINIIDDMYTPGHTPPRLDYAVAVRGPIVDDVHAAATRLWRIVSWTQLRRRGREREPRCEPNPARGSQRAAFVIRDNLGHRRDIEEAYLEAIAYARSEILIAMAYFLPGIRFRRALADAVSRGVRVVLLLQGRVEYFFLHHAVRALYGSLLEAGVEIQEYHKSFLHAKVAVVDGHWATVGSSNIDPFSLLMAREANVVVDDPGFALELRTDLMGLIASGATRVPRERWSEQPWVARGLSWMSYGIFRITTGMLGISKREDAV
jgi:cardiolipin synthase A/B